ncbi:hypothetical protein [Undibacterium sp. TJN19]|uniref:HzsA-related protein n=1 Tax=Undibacterium sp. TJN19 TaxID=3413055 RepID=UPI003BF11BC0
MALTACGQKNNQAQESPENKTAATMAILAFEAEKPVISAGEVNQLKWKVQGIAKLSLGAVHEAKTIDVSNTQGMVVQPGISTAYTLTATDQQGKISTATLTVYVHQALAAMHSYPVLFVTQVPLHTDQAARLSAFANHMTGIAQVPRGGDLMLRYPDGSLRNLTKEAGLGASGFQGATAIAVREPASHWSGKKAVFSMLTGAPQSPGQMARAFWQIYEVTGLARNEKVRISKVSHQDKNYNNVSPVYGSDEHIIFTSDRPHNGQAHLYPQLDEYEATPTISGLWSLDPASGQLKILSHTPSGAFTPIIDSYGRVIFTRWDHLQQDQLADRDRDALKNGLALPFNSYNYENETATSAKLGGRKELFPESRTGEKSVYGNVSAFRSNFFTAWQINQDGSGEETLNHVGQHELAFGFMTPSFSDDVHLKNHTVDTLHANQFALRHEAGLFHMREDPRSRGTYYATDARESGSFTSNHLVKFYAPPGFNPEKISLQAVTATAANDSLAGGRYRNPLPLSDGRLIASHTSTWLPPPEGETLENLRLRFLNKDAQTGMYVAGEHLSKGIYKSLSWWEGLKRINYHGALWEMDAVELRPQQKPGVATSSLETPERAVLAEAGINETDLRTWLQKNNLALIVTRDQTSRDRADMQQPYNLQVPGGVKTISTIHPDARVYPVSFFQIFEADLLRAYPGRPGRRVLAMPGDLDKSHNSIQKNAPAGSVTIASDGSTAAFVPAGRALTWQTTDQAGNAVVRERNWITFQRGEMRVCASCHGVNTVNQAGFSAPQNKPQALRELLEKWKSLTK